MDGLKVSSRQSVKSGEPQTESGLNAGTGSIPYVYKWHATSIANGERGGSVVECRTPEREVRGSRPTAAVLCPWARHFTPREYWLITQEAMAPSRHDWKIVDWDVKPQHNQPTNQLQTDKDIYADDTITHYAAILSVKNGSGWTKATNQCRWLQYMVYR